MFEHATRSTIDCVVENRSTVSLRVQNYSSPFWRSACQRLLLPFTGGRHDDGPTLRAYRCVKPKAKLLSERPIAYNEEACSSSITSVISSDLNEKGSHGV